MLDLVDMRIRKIMLHEHNTGSTRHTAVQDNDSLHEQAIKLKATVAPVLVYARNQFVEHGIRLRIWSNSLVAGELCASAQLSSRTIRLSHQMVEDCSSIIDGVICSRISIQAVPMSLHMLK